MILLVLRCIEILSVEAFRNPGPWSVSHYCAQIASRPAGLPVRGLIVRGLRSLDPYFAALAVRLGRNS
jgi:hypothetical protein